MKSPSNRAAVLAALSFLIVTFLSLLGSWIGSQNSVTPVTFWVVLGFVGLAAAGAVIQFIHLGGPGEEDSAVSSPPVLTTQPAPAKARLGRRQVPLYIGTVSGLVAGALLVLMLRPGIGLQPGDPLAPGSSASASPTQSGPQTSGPASPTSGAEAGAATVSAKPSVGSTYTDSIAVTVAVRSPLHAGNTYWLMVVFAGGANTVYKAEGKVPAPTGTYSFSISIAGSAVGSTRTIYVLQADRQATPTLQENFAHQSPSWDGNRTSLPLAGTARVSTSVSITKQAA
jgi:hypothetical protein